MSIARLLGEQLPGTYLCYQIVRKIRRYLIVKHLYMLFRHQGHRGINVQCLFNPLHPQVLLHSRLLDAVARGRVGKQDEEEDNTGSTEDEYLVDEHTADGTELGR